MSYKKWFEKHSLKHRQIVEKLSHLSDEELIEYFDYESLKINEPDFCPLFAKNKRCHDIKELNCYLCGCPNFIFDDDGLEEIEGKKLFSRCAIKSSSGKTIETKNGYHLDCSNCTVPHKKSYIIKVFSRSWKEMLSKG